MNSIIISINVDINEKRDEISLKKSSLTEMKDLLTNQLFSELSAVISAEISPTSDSLTVRVPLTAKPVLAILHHSLRRAVRAVLKNINLSVSANLTLQAVKIILSANSTLAISDSDLQAVRVTLLTHRSHDHS